LNLEAVSLTTQSATRRISRRAPARKTGRRRSGSRRRTKWRTLAVLAAAGLGAALIGWAALERAFAPAGNTSRTRFDAIIVLGSPADADGNPTPTQLARVTEAVHEYERGVAPRLILTGGPSRRGFVEAQVMARVAEALGVPASSIFQEPRSRNTIQNACYSTELMLSHGWRSAEVISSASHLPRAALIFSRGPLEWRTHAAPSLEPADGLSQDSSDALEILKTLRLLLYAQWTEKCG
jgi:uncharacterized SAM-binding protein YcdF (DUF218 family)